MNDIDITDRFNQAISALCQRIYQCLIKVPNYIKANVQEVRLRVNKPLMLYCKDIAYYIDNNGNAVTSSSNNIIVSTQKDIVESFRNICCYSVYSHQKELSEGFLVIKGGHRVGLCGSAVINNGLVTGIKDISSLNIRIARQITGSANKIIDILGYEKIMQGVLIIGAPASGKTTILRDLSRQLSLEKNTKTVIVDERGEIGSVWCGINQNDNGLCDILDGYPKGQGILQAVRVLSPDIIVCDEAGGMNEISAIEEGLNSGVSIITTAHASSIQDIRNRKQIQRLLLTGAFNYIVMLKSRKTPGEIEQIFTRNEVQNESCRSFFNHSIGVNVGNDGIKTS